MFQRNIKGKLHDFAKILPGIFLTGPRQSGKTTLLKMVFEKHQLLPAKAGGLLNACKAD